MIELLLINLTYIGYAMGLLAIVWLSNFAFSLYYNIKILSEPFEFSRFKDGFIKIIAVVLGTAFLTVGITLIPIFLQYIGVPIDDNYVEFLNIISIVVIFMKSVYSYTKQAYETLSNILTNKNR